MTGKEYLKYSMQRGWKFGVTCKNYFLNAEYIHPLKQDIVCSICNHILDSNESNIEKIYVFGSSVNNSCHQFSDLDICIKWCDYEYDAEGVLKPFTLPFLKWLSNTYGGNIDVVHYSSTIGIPLNEEIMKNGVIVYDKYVL